jgi:hypothetical protein
LRIRIVNALTGIIEGQPLSQLVPGFVYEVDDLVGGQLIVLRAAIEVRASDPAVDATDEEIDMSRLTGGVHVVPTDKADDRLQLHPKADRRRASDRRKTSRNERRS